MKASNPIRVLIAAIAVAAFASEAYAQTNALDATEYTAKKVEVFAPISGGKHPSKREAQEALEGLKELLPLSPTVPTTSTTNGDIAAAYACLGDEASAMKALELIPDPIFRNKRRIEVVYRLKGYKAAVSELATILDASTSDKDKIEYVIKLRSMDPEAASGNERFVDLALFNLSEVLAHSKNPPKGSEDFFPFCSQALKKGTVTPERLKIFLNGVIEDCKVPPIVAKAKALLNSLDQ